MLKCKSNLSNHDDGTPILNSCLRIEAENELRTCLATWALDHVATILPRPMLKNVCVIHFIQEIFYQVDAFIEIGGLRLNIWSLRSMRKYVQAAISLSHFIFAICAESKHFNFHL